MEVSWVILVVPLATLLVAKKEEEGGTLGKVGLAKKVGEVGEVAY